MKQLFSNTDNQSIICFPIFFFCFTEFTFLLVFSFLFVGEFEYFFNTFFILMLVFCNFFFQFFSLLYSITFFLLDTYGEDDQDPKKKLDDLIRLAELCIEVLQQNEEYHAEVCLYNYIVENCPVCHIILLISYVLLYTQLTIIFVVLEIRHLER